jgi:hypothetical protein
MLGEAMKDVDDQIRSARLSYRLHGDMEKYWPVVVERLTFLFQAIGYAAELIRVAALMVPLPVRRAILSLSVMILSIPSP